MPVAFVQAGELNYDNGYFANPGSFVDVFGASPVGTRYKNGMRFVTSNSGVTFATIAQASTHSDKVSLHLHRSSVFDSIVKYFDDATGNIYRSGSSLTTEATGLTANNKGFFVSYGDNVIWTNGTDSMQTILDANYNASTFVKNNIIAAPVSHDPKAKFVAVIKNHLLIANIDLTGVAAANRPAALAAQKWPDMVWWSKTDDPTRFGTALDTPTIVGSGYQPIPDEYGEITGLIGGDYALIFKSNSVYRLDGPPFSVTPIVYGTGTIAPRSIVKLFSDTYFWASNGPAMIDAAGNFRQITDGKINNMINTYFYDAGTGDVKNICAASSPFTNTVLWSQPFSPYGIEYNAQTGVFARLYTSAFEQETGVMQNAGGVVALKSMQSSGIDQNVHGLDFYGVSTLDSGSNRLYKLFRGSRDRYQSVNLYTSFAWPYLKLSGEGSSSQTRITRIRPVWRISGADPSQYTISVTSVNNPSSTIAIGVDSQTGATAEGWFEFSKTVFAAYHSINISVLIAQPTAVSFITDEGFAGVEIEYSEGNLRGR